MIETLLALVVVCAPVPRPRAKVEPPLAGVYICEGVSFEAVVWFSQDGKYGCRWGDSLFEGSWTLDKVKQTIEIKERKLGTTEALHPWSLPAPGKKGGTYELRKIAALP